MTRPEAKETIMKTHPIAAVVVLLSVTNLGCAGDATHNPEATRTDATTTANDALTATTGTPTTANDAMAATTDTLTTTDEKLGYALGLDIGMSLKQLGAEIDMAAFLHGVEHSLQDGSRLLTEEEALAVRQEAFAAAQVREVQQMKTQAEKNRIKGETFLAQNKTQDGVITTASGLQYTVVRAGDGQTPGAEDSVTVHYRGTLLDGTEFDSSYKRGKPATFQVNRVIKGWTEALQLMKVGSSYRLFVPSGLAYGESGTRGGPIGPNAVLIFDVELLGTK